MEVAATADSNNIEEEVDTITMEEITRTETGAEVVDIRTIAVVEVDIRTTAAVAVTIINSSAVVDTEMTVEVATVETIEGVEATAEEVAVEVISLPAINNDCI